MARTRGHLDKTKYLKSRRDALARRLADTTLDIAAPALQRASRDGDVGAVRALVSQGASLEESEADGRTPLRAASEEGHVDTVQVLIDAGANVDAVTDDKRTALLSAAAKGHSGVVQALLNAGANVHARDWENTTSLILASARGHTAVVQLLLDAGALVDASNDSNMSALTEAVRGHFLYTVRVLLAAGAYVSNASLNLTFMHSSLEMVNLLRGGGRARVGGADRRGSTLLAAIHRGALQDVKDILCTGNVDVDAAFSSNGSPELSLSPLCLAARAGHADIVLALLEAGADVNRVVHDTTPLIQASRHPETVVVRMLVSAGAYLDTRMASGWTALTTASSLGLVEVVKVLLRAGADPNVQGVNGQGAIDLALHAESVEAAVALAEVGSSMCTSVARRFIWSVARQRCESLLGTMWGLLFSRTMGESGKSTETEADAHLTHAVAFLKDVWETACFQYRPEARYSRLPPQWQVALHGCMRWTPDCRCTVSQFLNLTLAPEEVRQLWPWVGALRQLATCDGPSLDLGGEKHVQADWSSALLRAVKRDMLLLRYVGRESGHLDSQIVADAQRGDAAMQCAAHAGGVGRARDVLERLAAAASAGDPRESGRAGHMHRFWDATVSYSIARAYNVPLDPDPQASSPRAPFMREGARTGAPGAQAISNEELFAAVLGGDLHVLQELLDSEEAAGQLFLLRRTGLMMASECGNVELVHLFLQAGTDVNAANDEGWTPLLLASGQGDLEVLAALITAGAEANAAAEDGWTALMAAVEVGRLEGVELLVQAGANVNACDESGWTPLLIASQEGRVEIVRRLLDVGAHANKSTILRVARPASRPFLRTMSTKFPEDMRAAAGDVLVENMDTQEKKSLEDIVKGRPVVLHFMRRFGCQLCRLGLSEMSAMKPQLDELGVAMVSVGLEKLGYDEFKAGGFWPGEVYVDEAQEAFGKLGFKRYGTFRGMLSLLSGDVRAAVSRSNEKGVSGNFAGDGMQLGGTYVYDAEGKLLYSHRQDHFGDYPRNGDILDALRYTEKTGKQVPEEVADGTKASGPPPACAGAE